MPNGDWIYLGEGSYNKVYKSKDGTEVLKIQKSSDDETDTPERSVRLWNAINPHVSPPARLADTEYGSGWICPFIKGDQASDNEMADALIDVFNNTGRVVVDATAPKNFVKTPHGQVLCIDVGMALQFERREERLFAAICSKSMVSLNAWSELSDDYEPFFSQCEVKYPETVNRVKALVFMKNNRPDIYDANFLKTNPELVSKLAKAYDIQKNTLDRNALDHLDMTIKPAIFSIPQDKVPLEVRDFVSFLRSKSSSFAISDDKVQDMSLSSAYENSRDSNKPYVNIEIRNPDVALLFKQCVAEKTRLAEEKLAAEILAAKQEKARKDVTLILDSYIAERKGVKDAWGYTKEYSHSRLFDPFQKSFKQVSEAIRVLKGALNGEEVDLTAHLSTLRHGALGEKLKEFVKLGKANELVNREVDTVGAFIEALQEKVSNSFQPVVKNI